MSLISEFPIYNINFLSIKSVKNVKLFFTTIVISLVCFCVHGQNYPKVNIVSPTASALGKFVDFPVSSHTGVPDISIPIYIVQEGPLQLPISLSYHASGLKVMEPASWVGAGWAMNAGGVVSRNVKGLPDEHVSTDDKSFFSNNGFSSYFYSAYPSGGLIIDYQKFLEGRRDGEPDIYTFNFGSYGGKFYFREDLTAVLIPEGDIKIETIVKDGANTQNTFDYIQGFKITTPDGVKYHFGVTNQAGDTDPIEKSGSLTFDNLTYSDVVSSWYLYKIESADGKFSITITYRPEEYGYWTLSTKTDPTGHGATTPLKQLIPRGVAIQQIQFSNGTVDFVANNSRQDLSNKFISPLDGPNNWTNNAKSLDAITINSNQGAHCVSYNFSYDYFYDASTRPLPYVISQIGAGSSEFNTDRKRLKLNSFQKISCDNAQSEPPYRFYYYDESLVPRRLSFAQDHWGFYNGAVSNTTMLPLISTGSQSYYAATGDERSAKWPDMRAGALRLIQYPTGGGTEYVYEANRTLVTGNCSFERTNTLLATAFAGMNGIDGYGTATTFVVNYPTTYFYSIKTSGVASGSFYIDNARVASVSSSNTSTVENYIFLNEGTHTLQAYNDANAEYGSGNGVLSYLYGVTSTCDPSVEKTVGGLRIKQINKFGGSESQKLTMRYEYGNSNLYSIPSYVSKYKHPIIKGLDVYPTENGCIPHNGTAGSYPVRYATSPVSIHPMQSVQGYHIGYSQVKEISPDGGYIISGYNGNVVLPGGWNTMNDVALTKVNVNACTTNDPIYPQAPLPYDFTRGNLKSKKVFNSSGRKLRETNISEQYIENPVGVFGVTIGNMPYGSSNVALPVHYEIKSGRLLRSEQTEISIDENGNSVSTQTTTNFNSNYHRMPTRETKTSQNGVLETRHSYVPDLTDLSGCDYRCQSCLDAYLSEAETLYNEYLAKENSCITGVGCIDSDFKGFPSSDSYNPSYVWNGILPVYSVGGYGPCNTACNECNTPSPPWWCAVGCSSSTKAIRCRWASWIDYNFRLNEKRVIYTNCIRSCKQGNNCIANGLATSTNEGVKTFYAMLQANQLGKIESVSWKDNIFQSAAFLDYRPKDGDFTKIYLKDVYATETATPVSTFVQAYNSAGVIVKDPKYNSEPQLSYIYNNGQPVELKEQNGITTSYIWGFNNTVPIVKSVGSNYSTLNNAYTTLGTNLRSDPLLLRAKISTYTYNNPIVGISTIKDANGRLLTYEYDKLGRLIHIKDHDGKVLEQYEYTYRIN